MKVTYRDVQFSPAFDAAVRSKVVRLARLHPELRACDVTVARRRRAHEGSHLKVELRLVLDAGAVVVASDSGQDVRHDDAEADVALRDVFRAARRTLDALAEQQGRALSH